MTKITVDDLNGSEIKALLIEHVLDMEKTSPPESVHTLDIEALKSPNIIFWTLWIEQELAGCIALKELNDKQGEIKSMRTAKKFKNQGIATKLVKHLVAESIKREYQRINLESGSMDYFEPARALYKKLGFIICQPFGDYSLDPNSVFMAKRL